MSFPRGYRVIVDARRASLVELERVARQFVEPSIARDPGAAAALWKSIGTPVITADQPDGHYTGWALSPANDVEFFHLGVRQITKKDHFKTLTAQAHGLDGEALEERRH